MFNTHEEYRESWKKAYTEDPPVPLNLDLELASLCQLRCPFCYWGESEYREEMKSLAWDGKPLKRFMETSLAKRLIDEAAKIGIPALKMNARGESTLHPDYSEILIYARGKERKWSPYKTEDGTPIYVEDQFRAVGPAFHEILVNTHGNVGPEIIPGLMAATKVMISLDSTIPATYAKMRVGGDIEKAFKTIKELKRLGHPNLWVRRVITEFNKEEPFVERCKQLFGEEIQVSEHFCFDRNRNLNASIHGEDVNKFERVYCGYPSQRLLITSSGQALPCCVDWRAEMVVGNVLDQSLATIWAGEPIRNLRADLRSNRHKSEICKNCTSYLSFKRPERDYVADIEGRAKLDV